MAGYTFRPVLVLDESTGAPASYVTGVLRAETDGQPLAIFDLNDSQIAVVQVGQNGVSQSFKADVPDGLLDFGSAQIPVASQESLRAGPALLAAAEAAAARADAAEAASVAAQAAAEQAATAASVVVATPRFVFHGDDADFPRPDEAVLPVIWLGSVLPRDADPERDHWLTPSSLVPPVE